MLMSEKIDLISPALLKAQKQIGSAKKGSENPFFHSKYADLGSIMEACKDALNDNGIFVLQPVMDNVVETILQHESGQWMASSTPIVCVAQNDPQKLGSAISYARRYGLQSMLFIPAEDDDANSATPKAQATAPVHSQTAGSVSVVPTTTGTINSKCQYCGATGKYHKPGCPNAPKPVTQTTAQVAEEVFNQ